MLSNHPREPIFNIPSLLLFFAIALLGLHLWVEYGLDGWGRLDFIWQFGFTPRFFYDFHISGDPKFNEPMQIVLTYVLLLMGEGSWAELGLHLGRLVSYSFLHGDWVHLGLNLIWLVIFGAPFCRHLGNTRFVIFWVVTACLSALTHFAFHTLSPIPMIGASGVVSGLMGAATRYGFYRYPHAQLLPMKTALMNKSAVVFIGVWLAANLVVGLGVPLPGMEESNIAWEAHIGGLVAGFVLVGLFEKRKF